MSDSRSEQTDKILAWLDLEFMNANLPLPMTYGGILSIAVILTDEDYNEIAVGPDLVIHHNLEALNNGLDEWSRNKHTETGLLKKVRRSRRTTRSAERSVLEFLGGYGARKTIKLSGLSVHKDGEAMLMHMPQLHDFFRYDQFELSSVRYFMQKWMGAPETLGGEPEHETLKDVRRSIRIAQALAQFVRK